MKKELQIFKGYFPHLDKIYYDRLGCQLAAFVNFNTIKIFPLLHTNKIKIKTGGK
jgi:hypothetical protein